MISAFNFRHCLHPETSEGYSGGYRNIMGIESGSRVNENIVRPNSIYDAFVSFPSSPLGILINHTS